MVADMVLDWIPVSFGHHPLVARRARALHRTMTPAEKRLWRLLRGGRFAGLHFRRQHPVEGFIADFFCHTTRLVIEVDGEVHAQQLGYEGERDSRFEQRGYRVLRFTNSQVLNQTDAVLREIERAVAVRALLTGRNAQSRSPSPERSDGEGGVGLKEAKPSAAPPHPGLFRPDLRNTCTPCRRLERNSVILSASESGSHRSFFSAWTSRPPSSSR